MNTRMKAMTREFSHKTYKVAMIMILTTMLAGTAAAKETINSLPPMDAAAPMTFETISFGLG